MLRGSLLLLSARSTYAQPMSGDTCTFDATAGEPFEFGATFDISASNVQTWVAQAVIKEQYNTGLNDDGDTIGWQENVVYADPEMKIVFYPTAGTGEEPFEAVHDCGAGVIETARASCTDVAAGGTITIPPTSGTGATQPPCYNIKFNEQALTTYFTLLTTGVSYVAIFSEHGPTEFERGGVGGIHYLMDVDVRASADFDAAIASLQAADPIEPVFEDGVSNAPEVVEPWGIVIGTTFLVNVCTLIGVIFLAPAIKAKADAYPNTIFALANAFATGALLAAAFYLMLYEATHLITEPFDTPVSESDGEGGLTWKDDSNEAGRSGWWGSMILLGFISANLMETVVQAVVEGKSKKSRTVADSTEKTQIADQTNQVRVLCGILLGDFMHNLVDGVFIGAAFVGCSDSVGWSIVAATIYHELAQEVSDYLVLTDPMQGNLKPWKALVLNFVSGLSVVVGGLIVVGAAPSGQAEGLLLAFGGGVYVQIGATECAGRVNNTVKTTKMRLGSILFFCIGAISIGLVLLDHEHCIPGGGGHAH